MTICRPRASALPHPIRSAWRAFAKAGESGFFVLRRNPFIVTRIYDLERKKSRLSAPHTVPVHKRRSGVMPGDEGDADV